MNIQPYSDPWDKHGKKNPYDPWGPDIHKDNYKKWQSEKPKVVTINDLFPRLDRLSIGWSPLLDTLKEVTNAKPAYPPYDIIATDDNTNLLQVAVAGFTKKELSVTVQDAVLTITGKKKDKQQGDVLYQGIASRNFELQLAVAEYWEISNAAVEDGLLTVTFTKELPEEKKPKVIDIK
jgi:molecular chaperone IbpA